MWVQLSVRRLKTVWKALPLVAAAGWSQVWEWALFLVLGGGVQEAGGEHNKVWLPAPG